MMDSAHEISSLAAQVPDGTDGLVFVSAFGGLLAPHWRDDARATLVGLTLAHDRRHIARAVRRSARAHPSVRAAHAVRSPAPAATTCAGCLQAEVFGKAQGLFFSTGRCRFQSNSVQI